MSSADKITLPKLRGSENYIIWSIRMKALLIKDDLFNPIEDISYTASKNNKAISIIKLYCEDGPLLYLRDIVSAKDAWYRLESLYNPKGFTTEFLTLKDFFNTTLSEFNSMEEYLNKVKSLVDDLTGKDIILPNQVIIAWVLNSLNEDYEGFIQNITQSLRRDPKAYTVETLFTSLINEARGRENNKHTNLMFLKHKSAYKRKPYKGAYCEHCRSTSHMTNKCWALLPHLAPKGWKSKSLNPKKASQPKKANQPKKRLLRKNRMEDFLPPNINPKDFKPYRKYPYEKEDAIISHIINSPEPISDEIISKEPPSNLTRDEEDARLFDIADEEEVCLPLISQDRIVANKPQDYIKGLNPYIRNQNESDSLKVDFIIDSAATISTVSNLKYFSYYKPSNLLIKWGKAKSLEAKYKGDIYIRTNTGFIYLLKDIYYIPELGINILSISSLSDLIALFMKNKAILYNSSKKTIGIANKLNNLYYMPTIILYYKNSKVDENKAVYLYSTLKNNPIPISKSIGIEVLNKWHIRLGHIGIIAIKAILRDIGINLSLNDVKTYKNQQKCKVCLLSKDNRYIYKKSQDPSTYEILERIHSDLGGPLPPTYDKYIYYMTFLDKKSRYLWITLLYNKSNAYKAFERFKNLVENNKDNRKIREFFTDKGGEYINKDFYLALNKYGIKHRTTPSYTKEPNGLIERINLTLFNKVRALLIQSNSPNYL